MGGPGMSRGVSEAGKGCHTSPLPHHPGAPPPSFRVPASDTSGQGAKGMGALPGTPTAGSVEAALSPPIPKRPLRAWLSLLCPNPTGGFLARALQTRSPRALPTPAQVSPSHCSVRSQEDRPSPRTPVTMHLRCPGSLPEVGPPPRTRPVPPPDSQQAARSAL